MPSDIRPNLGIESNWAAGATGWDTGMNKNLDILDAIIFCSATTAVGTPPTTPAAGDVYLIPHTGTTGAWVGKEDQIAIYVVSSWIYLVPKQGWRVRKKASNPAEYWYFDGTSWAVESLTVTVHMSDLADVDLTGLTDGKILVWNAAASKWKVVTLLMADAPNDGLPYRRKSNAWELAPSLFRQFKNGTLTNGELFAAFTPETKTQFPIDFAGSVATVQTAPTVADAIFDIQKNGISVGSLTFTVGQKKGVFTAAAVTTCDPAATVPDQLQIVGPATANAALAGLSVSIKGVPVA